MAKTTIGQFKNLVTGKTYNIYCRHGYGKWRNSHYEVGNYTFGLFFRFGYQNEFIFLRQGIELAYPRYRDDLRRILNMVMKPRGLEIIELKVGSRTRIEEIELVKDI